MNTQEAAEKLRAIEAGALRNLAQIEDQIEHAEIRLQKLTAMLGVTEAELKQKSWLVSEARQQSVRDHDSIISEKQKTIRTLTAEVESLEARLKAEGQ
jgi:hypothetical protein